MGASFYASLAWGSYLPSGMRGIPALIWEGSVLDPSTCRGSTVHA